MMESNKFKFSYKKLWKLLIDKDISKTKLAELTKISPTTIAKLGNNECVNTSILIKICEKLNCGPEDIMEIDKSI